MLQYQCSFDVHTWPRFVDGAQNVQDLDVEMEYPVWLYPKPAGGWQVKPVLVILGRYLSRNPRQCNKQLSYMQWKVGVPQLPQAMLSYCWALSWSLTIAFLMKAIGPDGIVWVDITACNQHAIENGEMDEILQLPNVIRFVGQTIVMPVLSTCAVLHVPI